MSAPTLSALRNAYIVFDGNSSSPPWWAMLSGVFGSIHLLAAWAVAAVAAKRPRASETRRERRMSGAG